MANEVRISQQFAEVLADGEPNEVRVSQQFAEVLADGEPNEVRVSQQFVEVLTPDPSYVGNVFDAKVKITSSSTILFDGRTLITVPALDKFDGTATIKDATTNLFDGKADVNAGAVTNFFDGRLQILPLALDVFDGKTRIRGAAVNSFDGWVFINNFAENQFDGKLFIPDIVWLHFDGKARVKDVDIDRVSGKVQLTLAPVYLTFDGRVLIPESATGIFDGKGWVKDIATSLFDGWVKVGNNITELFDGWAFPGWFATGSFDGVATIVNYNKVFSTQQYAEVMAVRDTWGWWFPPEPPEIAVWPDGVPPPLRDPLVITSGDGVMERRTQSGRTELRRIAGTDVPDVVEVVFRLTVAQARLFRTWFHDVVNLGTVFFTADWFAEIGYAGYYGRILGYPKRRGREAPDVPVGYVDYDCVLILKETVWGVPWVDGERDGRDVRVTQQYAEGMGPRFDPVTRVTQQYAEIQGDWPNPITLVTQQYAEVMGQKDAEGVDSSGTDADGPAVSVTHHYAEVMVKVEVL